MYLGQYVQNELLLFKDNCLRFERDLVFVVAAVYLADRSATQLARSNIISLHVVPAKMQIDHKIEGWRELRAKRHYKFKRETGGSVRNKSYNSYLETEAALIQQTSFQDSENGQADLTGRREIVTKFVGFFFMCVKQG